MTKQFEFETENGEQLSGECNVECRDGDGADAYTDDVSLMRADGTLVEETELSERDQRRLERQLDEIASENAMEAYQDYLESAGDEYHDRMRDGE